MSPSLTQFYSVAIPRSAIHLESRFWVTLSHAARWLNPREKSHLLKEYLETYISTFMGTFIKFTVAVAYQVPCRIGHTALIKGSSPRGKQVCDGDGKGHELAFSLFMIANDVLEDK